MSTEHSTAALDRARRDPAVFAELLVGAPLWEHQLQVVRSPARYRVICAGRQVGKSRLLAVLALHQAFATPRSRTLLVSAGETASKRLLEEATDLTEASPLLSGSMVQEDTHTSLLTLSNGSTIRSVPSSHAKVRGWAVDLLILDEAGFIPDDIWRAAEPTIVARPGSRVLLSSSPWGAADHFFRWMWRRGMDAPDRQLASWHWPSSVSPMVDAELLEAIRERDPVHFAREYMAEWTDSAGAYFTEVELSEAMGDFPLVPYQRGVELGVVAGGVDWGYARDANALAVIAARPEVDDRGRVRFWVPWVEAAHNVAYADWVDHLVACSDVGESSDGFRFAQLVCEANGVGAMPSQVLDAAMSARGRAGVVRTTWTDARLKETAFGYIKLLMQQGRLELPPSPELLKQLRALEFEQLASGGVRLAVPERLGHDDLAMSLALAATAVMGNDLPVVDERVYSMAEVLGDEELLDDYSIGGSY